MPIVETLWDRTCRARRDCHRALDSSAQSIRFVRESRRKLHKIVDRSRETLEIVNFPY